MLKNESDNLKVVFINGETYVQVTDNAGEQRRKQRERAAKYDPFNTNCARRTLQNIKRTRDLKDDIIDLRMRAVA